MFKRPGKKLKAIAVIIFFFFIALGLIVGVLAAAGLTLQAQETQIPMLRSAPSAVVIVVVCTVVGAVVGWINSILLYAFGSLVDNVEIIKTALEKPAQTSTTSTVYRPSWMK